MGNKFDPLGVVISRMVVKVGDAGVAGGGDAESGKKEAEEERQPQPQVLFSELWADKSERVRRCEVCLGEPRAPTMLTATEACLDW